MSTHSYNLRPRNPNYHYPTEEFDENNYSSIPVSNESPIMNQNLSPQYQEQQINQQQDQQIEQSTQMAAQSQTLTSNYIAEQLSQQMMTMQATIDSQLAELNTAQQSLINQETFISSLNNLASYQQNETNQQLTKLNSSLCQNQDLKTILQEILNSQSVTTQKLIDAIVQTNTKFSLANSSIDNTCKAMHNFLQKSLPNTINQLNLQYNDHYQSLQKIVNILPKQNNNNNLDPTIQKIDQQVTLLSNQQNDFSKAIKDQNQFLNDNIENLYLDFKKTDSKIDLQSTAIDQRFNKIENTYKQFEDSAKEKFMKIISLEKKNEIMQEKQENYDSLYQELSQKFNKCDLDLQSFKTNLQNFDVKASYSQVTSANTDLQKQISKANDQIVDMTASISLIIDSIKKQNASFNQKLQNMENETINTKFEKLSFDFTNFQNKISEEIQYLSNSVTKNSFTQNTIKPNLQELALSLNNDINKDTQSTIYQKLDQIVNNYFDNYSGSQQPDKQKQAPIKTQRPNYQTKNQSSYYTSSPSVSNKRQQLSTKPINQHLFSNGTSQSFNNNSSRSYAPIKYNKQRYQPQYFQKIVIEKNNWQIIDTARDGNCFYKALALCLGYRENSYLQIKNLIADFLNSNRQVFDNIADIDYVISQIRKNYEPASYEVIYIAAQCFQKTIKLYRNRFFNNFNPETFENYFGSPDGEPIRIQFTGSYKLGHFLAVVKQQQQKQSQMLLEEPSQQAPITSQSQQKEIIQTLKQSKIDNFLVQTRSEQPEKTNTP